MTRGEIEATVSAAMPRFDREHMGRGRMAVGYEARPRRGARAERERSVHEQPATG